MDVKNQNYNGRLGKSHDFCMTSVQVQSVDSSPKNLQSGYGSKAYDSQIDEKNTINCIQNVIKKKSIMDASSRGLPTVEDAISEIALQNRSEDVEGEEAGSSTPIDKNVKGKQSIIHPMVGTVQKKGSGVGAF